jgi:glucokinase
MQQQISDDGQWIFGADIGGTRTKYGVTDCGGAPVKSQEATEWVHSLVKQGPETTLRQIADAFKRKTEQVGTAPLAIGLACAGQIGTDGVVRYSPNFGELWRRFPLAERAKELLGSITVVENDANAHTLAEYSQLVSRDNRYRGTSGFLVTLGTGLGAGRMNRGGFLERGEHGWGEELGHQPMRPGAHSSVDLVDRSIACGCGQVGCAEQYTSLQFIERELLYRRDQNPNHELYRNENLTVAATKVLALAEKGDLFARSIMEDQALNVGLYLGELIETRDPAWTLIGGGVTDAGPELRARFLRGVLNGIERIVARDRMQLVLVDYASLGSDAGWVGGAVSAAQLLEREWFSRATKGMPSNP